MSTRGPRRVIVTHDPRELSAREAVAAIGKQLPSGSVLVVLPTIEGLTPEAWGQWARADQKRRERERQQQAERSTSTNHQQGGTS